MSPLEQEIAIKYIMETLLSDDQLADLDDRLTNKIPDESAAETAQDAALTRRRHLLSMDAKTRVAARKCIAGKIAADAAAREAITEQFPAFNRLKRG